MHMHSYIREEAGRPRPTRLMTGRHMVSRLPAWLCNIYSIVGPVVSAHFRPDPDPASEDRQDPKPTTVRNNGLSVL